MGKERDKLLWQQGQKPESQSDAEAYREYMRLRAEAGNLPLRMQKLIEQAYEDTAGNPPSASAETEEKVTPPHDPAESATGDTEKNITPQDVLYHSPYKGWLVDQKFLKLTEEASKEIWTIIPLLTFSIQPGTVLYEGVQAGIRRGVKHKIFMPDTPKVHGNIAEYLHQHRPVPGQVEFILIPEDEYLFHTVLSLYNPLTKNPTAIEYLPAEHLATWVRMDADYTRSIIKTAQILVKKYRNDSHILTESILRHIADRS